MTAEWRRNFLDVEHSGSYPQQPILTNPFSQSLLLTVASAGAAREKKKETCKLVKQDTRAFYSGHAAVNSILAFGTPGCTD